MWQGFFNLSKITKEEKLKNQSFGDMVKITAENGKIISPKMMAIKLKCNLLMKMSHFEAIFAKLIIIFSKFKPKL